MARRKLQEDATIADVIGILDNAEDYVRGALGNMVAFKKRHGSVHIRIGVTGVGIVPHYRLEPSSDDNDFIADFIEGGEAAARHFMAFHGRNHKQLEWGMGELRGDHWSRGAMNFDQVQNLLGNLRGFTRKVATHATGSKG